MGVTVNPSFEQLRNKPTTIGGFGITDVNWTNLGGKPTTVAGFGISDLGTAIAALTQYAKSIAASGYQKLPSGLIIQWGSLLVNASSAATFTFPLSFPTSCVLASIADKSTPGAFNSTVPAPASVQVTNGNGAGHEYAIIAIGY